MKKHWSMITYVFQKNREDLAFQLFIILQKFTREICYFHSLTAINAKISVLVIFVGVYLLSCICYYTIWMTVSVMLPNKSNILTQLIWQCKANNLFVLIKRSYFFNNQAIGWLIKPQYFKTNLKNLMWDTYLIKISYYYHQFIYGF